MPSHYSSPSHSSMSTVRHLCKSLLVSSSLHSYTLILDMDQSPLRELPAELRIMIYELVVEEDVASAQLMSWRRRCPSRQNFTTVISNSIHHRQPRITETCKEIRDETLTIYYSRLFAGPYRYPSFCCLMRYIYGKPHIAQYIKKLTFLDNYLALHGVDYLWWDEEYEWKHLARLLIESGFKDHQIEWTSTLEPLPLQTKYCFNCTMRLNLYKYRSSEGNPSIPNGCCNIAEAAREFKAESEKRERREQGSISSAVHQMCSAARRSIEWISQNNLRL